MSELKQSIEYLENRISNNYGKYFVQSILEKYDAHSIEDLSPNYYSSVFDELSMLDEDL